jgi:hypothetical protein
MEQFRRHDPKDNCYFRGKSGTLYYYGWLGDEIEAQFPDLMGRHIREQIEALGLLEEFDGGESPCSLPYTFTDFYTR